MSVKLRKCPKGKDLAKLVPFPRKDANKYSRGKLVVVGGSAAYPGAACLSSSAALRMGAGYVEVVCAPESLPIVRSTNPNLVVRSWEGWLASSSGLGETDARHPVACLVGPGLEGVPEEAPMVLDVLRLCRNPVVVDGGAISALASEGGRTASSLRAEAGLVTVVTPHLGEAARLAAPFKEKPPKGPSSERKELARFAQKLSDCYGATMVLKGPDTYIACAKNPPDGSDDVVRVMDSGTPALAKAGTGDVLSGMLASLLAQGLPPLKAAELATSLHARAGCVAARRLTEVSVCATDVVECIAQAVSDIC